MMTRCLAREVNRTRDMNIVQGKAGNAGSAGGGSGASSVAATGGTWFAVRGRLREYQRSAARAAYNATVGARLQSGRAVDERLALAFLEAACLLRVEGAHVHTSAVLARAAAALFEARQ